MEPFQGLKLRIEYCDGCRASLDEALAAFGQVKHRDQARAKIRALLERLGNTGTLRTPKSFNTEAALPGNAGHFYAVKHHELHAYGWFSQKHPATFIVSHYTYKNWKKLRDADTERVHRHWHEKED